LQPVAGLDAAPVNPNLAATQDTVNETAGHPLEQAHQIVIYSLTTIVLVYLYLPDRIEILLCFWHLAYIIRFAYRLMQSFKAVIFFHGEFFGRWPLVPQDWAIDPEATGCWIAV
jgi:hypothetical protein